MAILPSSLSVPRTPFGNVNGISATELHPEAR
jgi:hypothetical protein